MDAPPVQYVRTIDGYDIAYSVTGRGVPLVFVPGQFSHLSLFWSETRMHGPWVRGLASRYRLVQFDGRGQGLSSRDIGPVQTIETLGIDLEAVADRLQLERFVLLARWFGSHIAVRYAVAHPDRVAALILITCAERNSAWPDSIYQTLPQQNWEVFLTTQSVSNATAEEVQARRARQSAASNRVDLAVRARAFAASNIEEILPLVNFPTLVLHPREYILLPEAESMKVAAKIPGAHFAFIEGEMLPGDPVTGLRAVEEFLSGITGLRETSESAAPSPVLPQQVGLSVRQLQVLQLIAQGKTNREIADQLVLSERTVQRHIADLYLKIDVRNRSEATSYALSRLS